MTPAPFATFALVGNPNCGKTALFNALTGGRQKVANYAGVTVERKEGLAELPDGRRVRLIDLPGTYSLRARSPDEAVTRDAVLGRLRDEPAPDVILCIADATNLGLVLRLALELKSAGRPVVERTAARLNRDSRRVSSTSARWSSPVSAMYPRSMSCFSASAASNGSMRISGGCSPASPGSSSQLGTVAGAGASTNASARPASRAATSPSLGPRTPSTSPCTAPAANSVPSPWTGSWTG